MDRTTAEELPAADPATARRYRDAGWWGDTTLSEKVAAHASGRPRGVAFIEADRQLTWADYDRAADRAADRIRDAGLRPGDRLAVVLPDGPEVHAWFIGAERAGVVVVGIGPRAGEAEIRHLVARSGARGLVSGPVLAGRAAGEVLAAVRPVEVRPFVHLAEDGSVVAPASDHAPAPPSPGAPPRLIGPDDLFLLNSTSGTTGLPKCVMHHQNRWFYFHRLAVEAGGMSESDVFMSLLPAPYGFGLWTAHFTPTILGVPVVVMSRFRPGEAIGLIERHRVSVLACVSTQFVMMLNDPALAGADLSSLRVMFTGGEAVPYSRALEFEERTGARVLQFYGSNETGALSRTTTADPADKRLRTAGRPIPEMEVRLLDGDADVTASGGPGEPVCRGPATSLGYWDDPAANARLLTADGWTRTGDLAELDPEGYLRIVGRLSDIIIRGGKNISAPQVEEEVGSHPGVAMVAAVPMSDPVFGERVCVFVVARPGWELTLDVLTSHMTARGAGKELLPEHLVLVDELPRASGGKVAKSELRRRLEAGAGTGP